MRKVLQNAIFFVLPICLIMLLCWHLFVPSIENSLPIKVIEEGYKTFQLDEELCLRADIIELMPDYHTRGLEKHLLHYVLIDKDGNEHYIPNICVPLTEEIDTDCPSSFIAKLDGKIIISISTYDDISSVEDSLNSKITTIDETQYADVVEEKYVGMIRDGYYYCLGYPLSNLHVVVVDDLPSDYELNCGTFVLTSEDIQNQLALLR